MSIITLTSDFGLKDHYVAVVKGAILSRAPGAIITDISHLIRKFDVLEAAFIIREACLAFPPKTIHIVSVNSLSTERQIVGKSREKHGYKLMAFHDHYFIGTDNGLFSLAFGNEPELIIDITTEVPSTFPARDVFAPAAARIANGEAPEALGTQSGFINRATARTAYYDASSIKGEVAYTDVYENAITNITRETFDRVGKGRKLNIQLKSSRNYAKKYPHLADTSNYIITELNNTYSDALDGEIVAFFNSSGLLEIAINNGNAAGLLGLATGEKIEISFDD